jgi:hypothetical protein
MTTIRHDLKDVRQAMEGIRVSVEKLGRLTHAGVAMVVAAALDRLLEEALLTKFVRRNREVRDKLFGDFGALRSLGAKIDLSLALGLADRETHKQLSAVRRVRNCLAHTEGFLDFDSLAVRNLLSPCIDASSKSAPIDDFMSIAATIELAITAAAGLPHRGLIDKVNADR